MSPKFILGAAAGVLCLALVGVLATGERGRRLAEDFNSRSIARSAPRGLLRAVHVEGAAHGHGRHRQSGGRLQGPAPPFGLDLEALRKRIEQVGWVKEARVVRLLPDTLVVSVVERKQMAAPSSTRAAQR